MAWTTNPFSIEYVKTLLEDRHQARYYSKYLTALGCQTVLVEDQYVDKSYLIDYCGFYARTFSHYERFCKRVHFFASSFGQTEFEDAFLGKKEAIRQIASSYLGFIVKKPISRSTVGRTLLKTFSDVGEDGSRRHFITVRHAANLFGMNLDIDSMQYQQQDGAVGACATATLWMCLDKLHEVFEIPLLSPYEITTKANDIIPSMGRSFPSEGLSHSQICGFLKKMSLEVECINIDNVTSADYVKSGLYAYLRFGIPIVAVLTMKKGGDTFYHAVAVVGYRKARPQSENGNVASDVSGIYVHDDQIGPYSKVMFEGDNPSQWLNEWRAERGFDSVALSALFIPMYPKIRLSFTQFYRSAVNEVEDIKRLASEIGKFEILIASTNQYKNEIWLLEPALLIDEGAILYQNLPHYLWVVRLHVKNEDGFIDLLYDATEPFPAIFRSAFFIRDSMLKTGLLRKLTQSL